jgi:hypothetical protein
MKRGSFAALVVGLGIGVACNASVAPVGHDGGTVEGGASAEGGGGATDSGGGGGALQWWTTCGYPVCMSSSSPDGGTEDAGTQNCPAQGTPCSTKGEACGVKNDANCGVTFVCDDQDPKGPSGNMCPVSTRKYKDGINYLSDDDLMRLHDETLATRLATYRYTGPLVDPNDPSARHLGFVIEDQPQSFAVQRGRDRVDLYGYMSMAVATMQVQEKEIADLKREVRELKKTCGAK